LHLSLSQLDQFTDLSQGETESLHLLDEVKALDAAFAIEAEAT